jgi:hypothetical protein
MQGSSLTEQLQEFAANITARILRLSKSAISEQGILSLQFSTRELFPNQPDDVLTIDATGLVADGGSSQSEVWARLATALFTIKQQITAQYGRPRLRVHGSKHLTAATMFGYVFRASSGFQIEIRQRSELWTTDCTPWPETNFEVHEEPGSYHTDSLFVEISATGKSVRDGVRRYLQETGQYPFLSLRFSLPLERYRVANIDNAVCCAMAYQVTEQVATAVSQNDVAEIHLFAAIPQALAMMIGYHLNALRPMQLYEYVGGTYQPSYRIPMDGR